MLDFPRVEREGDFNTSMVSITADYQFSLSNTDEQIKQKAVASMNSFLLHIVLFLFWMKISFSFICWVAVIVWECADYKRNMLDILVCVDRLVLFMLDGKIQPFQNVKFHKDLNSHIFWYIRSHFL